MPCYASARRPPRRAPPIQSGFLSRRCACGGSLGVKGECSGCGRMRALFRPVSSALTPRSLAGVPGARFDHDFSQVRVIHTTRSPGERTLLSPNPVLQAHLGGNATALTEGGLRAQGDRGTSSKPFGMPEDQMGAQASRHGSFTIDAGRPLQGRCPDGTCGGSLIVPLIRVTSGSGCPALAGQRVTEEVEELPPRPGDQSCGDLPVQTGPGCPITALGSVTGCMDEYSLCGGLDRFPQGTCTRRTVQRYFIGRRVIAVNYINFIVTNTRSASGGITRRCTGTVEFEPGSSMNIP